LMASTILLIIFSNLSVAVCWGAATASATESAKTDTTLRFRIRVSLLKVSFTGIMFCDILVTNLFWNGYWVNAENVSCPDCNWHYRSVADILISTGVWLDVY